MTRLFSFYLEEMVIDSSISYRKKISYILAIYLRVIIVNEDLIKHEICISALHFFIDFLMVIIILLSLYVAFRSILNLHAASNFTGVLSIVIILLMFALMAVANSILERMYYDFKNLMKLFKILRNT